MLGLGLGLQNGRARKTIVNLLYPYGNFETLDGWTLSGTGIAEASDLQSKTGQKSLHYILVNQGRYIDIDIMKGNVGDVLYCAAYGYRVSGAAVNVVVRMADYTSGSANPVTVMSKETINASNNNWVFSSSTKTLLTNGVRVRVGSGDSINMKVFYDGFVLANLTKVGLTQSEMDAIVQSRGYFESISI